MAWDASKPTDNGLLINFPGQCRANWDAIATGTDSALLVTNAKVDASAGIVESKLTFSATGHGHTGSTGGKKIELTTAVTGACPIANGGTGQTTAQAAIDALLPDQSGQSGKVLATDGSTSSWGTGSPFVTGDWIISSVTTAHSGWTNVSATYSNKFMRINATPLTTGGADTHDHGAATGSHTLTISEMPSHDHDVRKSTTGGTTNSVTVSSTSVQQVSGVLYSTGGDGGHTHTVSSVDNIPAYVQVVIFEKD